MTTSSDTTTDQTDASTIDQTAGRDDFTRFQHDLLTVLAGFETGRYTPEEYDGAHGIGIMHRLEARYDVEVNHGRLYPNLETLIERGFIEKHKADRRTNIYELTDVGLEFVRRRAQWVNGCIDVTREDTDEDDGPVIPEAAVIDAAGECETVDEVSEFLNVSKRRARSLLVHADQYGDVREGGRA